MCVWSRGRWWLATQVSVLRSPQAGRQAAARSPSDPRALWPPRPNRNHRHWRGDPLTIVPQSLEQTAVTARIAQGCTCTASGTSAGMLQKRSQREDDRRTLLVPGSREHLASSRVISVPFTFRSFCSWFPPVLGGNSGKASFGPLGTSKACPPYCLSSQSAGCGAHLVAEFLFSLFYIHSVCVCIYYMCVYITCVYVCVNIYYVYKYLYVIGFREEGRGRES